MTIPARMEDAYTAREDRSGPVFSVDRVTGNLHMRYTVWTRHVHWKDDPDTLAAVACPTKMLVSDSPCIYRGLLEPGMGLISNVVLHDRAGFQDDQPIAGCCTGPVFTIASRERTGLSDFRGKDR